MYRMGWIHSHLLRLRRTLWAGVTDRIEHVTNFGDSLVRRDASWRILTGDCQGTLAGMRVGTILHPAVLLAFADRTGFL